MMLFSILLSSFLAQSTAFIPCSSRHSSIASLNMISDGRRPLMGGNWKLNPTKVVDATNLASEVVKLTTKASGVDVAIFPPHPFLVPVNACLAGSAIKLGGQNCFFENSGAYTGAVSTCMLKDVGATYVLAGHSERRTLFKDNDAAISKKVKKILKEGLKPVLCIGESQTEYEAGLNREVCAIQILKDLANVTPEEMLDVVLAYEPVWAIGTGLVCPKEVAQDVHEYIRSLIKKKFGDEIARKTIIQYGGSVKADNVKELMAMPDIDGCLIGGASLTADSFSKIVNYQLW
eukprot:gene11666-15621_t